jgi:glucose/arabinose dehydrogenase
MKKIVFIFLIILIIGLILFLSRSYIEKIFFRPQKAIKDKLEQNVLTNNYSSDLYDIIFNNLEVPWSILFLNDDQLLVTERSGKVKILSLKNKNTIQEFKIDEVTQVGEGGLLGAEIHPDFYKNNFVYFYYTTKEKENLINRVERYKLILDSLTYKLIKDKIIINDIPANNFHNGGRIKFGPDGYLYVTTGDAGDSNNSQNIKSLAGKILRITDDGMIPKDNPFNNLVYAYGIRNSQGIAWDVQGNLWAIDHGRSGVKSGLDEINLIQKGKNYGWPVIQGDATREEMEKPVINSGPDITWAPADLIYLNGNLFFTGLRGQGLYQYNLKEKKLKVNFFEKFGRLRALVLGPDGNLYMSTSNRDGRGFVNEGDDKIIKINTKNFFEDETNKIEEKIIIDFPKPNEIIISPLIIKGKARGNWFFEASFPVILTDWDGKIIAEHYASAKLDPNDPNSTWMTDDFVPFEAKLEFKSPVFLGADENHFSRRGYLIFKKDNPSGLPEYDDYFEMPVIFK